MTADTRLICELITLACGLVWLGWLCYLMWRTPHPRSSGRSTGSSTYDGTYYVGADGGSSHHHHSTGHHGSSDGGGGHSDGGSAS